MTENKEVGFAPFVAMAMMIIFIVGAGINYVMHDTCCFCDEVLLKVEMIKVTLPNGTNLYFCPEHFKRALYHKNDSGHYLALYIKSLLEKQIGCFISEESEVSNEHSQN